MTGHAQVPEEDMSRVRTCRSVDAAARVTRSAPDVEPLDRSSMAEPTRHRTEDHLLVQREGASGDVSTYQIGVRNLEIVGGLCVVGANDAPHSRRIYVQLVDQPLRERLF